VDLAEVAGQLDGKFALEIAAAGGHHMFLHGPPGVGKTLLAERLPSILPGLEADEALEVTAVHSVAGQLPVNVALLRTPPFRAPHHSASVAAVVGGGSGFARPGAASLAHRGVLFLDEAPEFRRGVLDALRQPLESGRIVLDRARGAVEYPARFQLVLAANPCPCGLARTTDCRCPPMARIRYLGRLSGPLLDRVDLAVQLEPPSRADLLAGTPGETSAAVAGRVALARARSVHRWRDNGWRYNAHIPGSWLRGSGGLDGADLGPIHESFARGALSPRGVDRVLRVAWTLADLAGRDRPRLAEVSTALSLRTSAAHVGLVA
jgi:magnesium chelatase family protein